jgi:hypothetical protein
MLRRVLVPTLALTLAAGLSAASPASRFFKWPPWLSIESPVNPFDANTSGAVLLVHTMVREGATSVGDLEGSAEGLIAGQRRSITLRFDPTARQDVYALRRQWPDGSGPWVIRVTLLRNTTALVSLDRAGMVSSVVVPTRLERGMSLPRQVSSAEVDSMLTAAVATNRVASSAASPKR